MRLPSTLGIRFCILCSHLTTIGCFFYIAIFIIISKIRKIENISYILQYYARCINAILIYKIFVYEYLHSTCYRVFRSRMWLLKWLKMTEKPNINNKTKCYYNQNIPPFYFTSSAEISWLILLSDLTYVRSQDSAENFDLYCYEIYWDDVL